MEKQIQKDLEDNLLIYQTRKMALNSFWDQYIELKKELKESTRTNYIYMYDNYVALTLAKRTSPQSSIVKSRSFIYPLFTKEGSSRTVWR